MQPYVFPFRTVPDFGAATADAELPHHIQSQFFFQDLSYAHLPILCLLFSKTKKLSTGLQDAFCDGYRNELRTA